MSNRIFTIHLEVKGDGLDEQDLIDAIESAVEDEDCEVEDLIVTEEEGDD